MAELNGIKRLKAVVNPENHAVLNWIVKCNSYEEYQDQSVFHVVDIPIPAEFYRNEELATAIRKALSGEGRMDNAAQFAMRLELKRMGGGGRECAEFYDELEEKDSDTEDFTVTCSSYDDDSRSGLFTSNNHRRSVSFS